MARTDDIPDETWTTERTVANIGQPAQQSSVLPRGWGLGRDAVLSGQNRDATFKGLTDVEIDNALGGGQVIIWKIKQ